MVTSDLPCAGGSFGVDRLQRQIVEGRRLARYAVVIHGVGTVGRDLHLEDGVVALAGNAFDGDAREREFVRKTGVVDRQVNEVAQPMRRNFHVQTFAVRSSSRESPSKPANALTIELDSSNSKLLPKLLQKPYIALKEKLNVIYAVFQNRDPFHAHAEGES